MNENRRAVRKRTLLSGHVLVGTASVYDCTIRDLSDMGAKLVFASPTLIADDVYLRVW